MEHDDLYYVEMDGNTDDADERGVARIFSWRKPGFNQSGGFSPVIAEFGSFNKTGLTY